MQIVDQTIVIKGVSGTIFMHFVWSLVSNTLSYIRSNMLLIGVCHHYN